MKSVLASPRKVPEYPYWLTVSTAMPLINCPSLDHLMVLQEADNHWIIGKLDYEPQVLIVRKSNSQHIAPKSIPDISESLRSRTWGCMQLKADEKSTKHKRTCLLALQMSSNAIRQCCCGIIYSRSRINHALCQGQENHLTTTFGDGTSATGTTRDSFHNRNVKK